MKTEEIAGNNKLIAKFMNVPIHEATDDGYDFLILPEGLMRICLAEYHSSWDWLIPTIDKIYDTEGYFQYRCETSSPFSDGGIEINTKFIETTWQSVIEFIKWYNNSRDDKRKD